MAHATETTRKTDGKTRKVTIHAITHTSSSSLEGGENKIPSKRTNMKGIIQANDIAMRALRLVTSKGYLSGRRMKTKRSAITQHRLATDAVRKKQHTV